MQHVPGAADSKQLDYDNDITYNTLWFSIESHDKYQNKEVGICFHPKKENARKWYIVTSLINGTAGNRPIPHI